MLRNAEPASSPTTGRSAVARPASLAEILRRQEDLDLLRFITCGSMDDGKSTLIGRLLWDCRQLFDDQVAALKTESRK